QGEFMEAREELEQSRKIRTTLLGDRHPALSSSWNELGSLYRQQGDNEQAVAAFRHGVEIDEQTLGPENIGTLTEVINIAQALAFDGRGDEAAPYLDRVEATLARQNLAPNQNLNVKWTRTLVLNAQGKYAEAAKLAKDSLGESTLALGPE